MARLLYALGIRFARARDLPAAAGMFHGQLRLDPSSGADDPDNLVLCANDGSEVYSWEPLLRQTRLGNHFKVANTAPPTFTLALGGGGTPNAGTTASLSGSVGDDNGGFVQLVPNGAGISAGVQIGVTFTAARTDVVYGVMLQARSSAARTLGAQFGPTSIGTTGFSLTTNTALTPGSTYQWNYFVFGFTPS